jgi:hypothetical protein
LVRISHFAELFGLRRPVRFDPPIAAGEYEESLHGDTGKTGSFLEEYLQNRPAEEPKAGGHPKETKGPDEEE